MTAPAASPASDVPARILFIIGGLALAWITLASPGATRMFAWPGTLALGLALAIPVVLLVARGLDARAGLRLPGRSWLVAFAILVAALVASALASPFRPSSLLWTAPELSASATF